MEVKSTIKDSVDVMALRKLSGLPDSAMLKVAGEIRPADAPAGFFALFEYPFKIGFKWPYSPLSRAFMTRFNLSPGQLMPQFWRVIQVIERVTKDWGRPAFSVNDLLTAYSVKPTDYDRYGLFPKGRGDTMLVHGTQVHDRGWKSRYVFVRSSSVLGEGGWVAPEWNSLEIDFSFEATEESKASVERFLSYSIGERLYSTQKAKEVLVESDDEVTQTDPEVQVISEEDLEGSSKKPSRRAEQLEAARRAALKKKEMAGGEPPAKRTRSASETIDPSHEVARKTDDVVDASPLKSAPPEDQSKGVKAAKTPVKLPKKTSFDVGSSSLNITLPKGFLEGDVMKNEDIFPAIEQFLLPSQKEQFAKLRVFKLALVFILGWTIKGDMRAKMASERAALKEADKAKEKVFKLAVTPHFPKLRREREFKWSKSLMRSKEQLIMRGEIDHRDIVPPGRLKGRAWLEVPISQEAQFCLVSVDLVGKSVNQDTDGEVKTKFVSMGGNLVENSLACPCLVVAEEIETRFSHVEVTHERILIVGIDDRAANVVADKLSRKVHSVVMRVLLMRLTATILVLELIRSSKVDTVKQRGSRVNWPSWGCDIRRLLTRSGRVWVLVLYEVIQILLDEFHKPKFSIHSGTTKNVSGLEYRLLVAGNETGCGSLWSKREVDSNSRGHVEGVRVGGSKDIYLPLAEFSCNNWFYAKAGMAPYKIWYGRRCRTPLFGKSGLHWNGSKGDGEYRDDLRAVMDRQKSYADKRRSDLEFIVGDKVLLKVSSWKGVIRFRTRGKLGPSYIGPFKVIACVGKVAYRIELPSELSQSRKCLADKSAHIPRGDIQVDGIGRLLCRKGRLRPYGTKRLDCERPMGVSKGSEWMWEPEAELRASYPKLFLERKRVQVVQEFDVIEGAIDHESMGVFKTPLLSEMVVGTSFGVPPGRLKGRAWLEVPISQEAQFCLV
ncbi:LOW QUALITY PROTEIN: hypothetical protein OSB04_021105, partial [Centaurea solstitialis]